MASKYIALQDGHNLHRTAFANAIEHNIWWTVFLTNRKYHIKFSYYSGEIWLYNVQVAAYDAIIQIHAAVWMWWIWSESHQMRLTAAETVKQNDITFGVVASRSIFLNDPNARNSPIMILGPRFPEMECDPNLRLRAISGIGQKFKVRPGSGRASGLNSGSSSSSAKHGKNSGGFRAYFSARLRPLLATIGSG